eukprot:snap_masked-scaffold_32-processed-gene-1.11-mRNA-1 protein AED:1.00 eAED:1.00 QI:0/-1/0/0/-1/1/1/0/564
MKKLITGLLLAVSLLIYLLLYLDIGEENISFGTNHIKSTPLTIIPVKKRTCSNIPTENLLDLVIFSKDETRRRKIRQEKYKTTFKIISSKSFTTNIRRELSKNNDVDLINCEKLDSFCFYNTLISFSCSSLHASFTLITSDISLINFIALEKYLSDQFYRENQILEFRAPKNSFAFLFPSFILSDLHESVVHQKPLKKEAFISLNFRDVVYTVSSAFKINFVQNLETNIFENLISEFNPYYQEIKQKAKTVFSSLNISKLKQDCLFANQADRNKLLLLRETQFVIIRTKKSFSFPVEVVFTSILNAIYYSLEINLPIENFTIDNLQCLNISIEIFGDEKNSLVSNTTKKYTFYVQDFHLLSQNTNIFFMLKKLQTEGVGFALPSIENKEEENQETSAFEFKLSNGNRYLKQFKKETTGFTLDCISVEGFDLSKSSFLFKNNDLLKLDFLQNRFESLNFWLTTGFRKIKVCFLPMASVFGTLSFHSSRLDSGIDICKNVENICTDVIKNSRKFMKRPTRSEFHFEGFILDDLMVNCERRGYCRLNQDGETQETDDCYSFEHGCYK